MKLHKALQPLVIHGFIPIGKLRHLCLHLLNLVGIAFPVVCILIVVGIESVGSIDTKCRENVESARERHLGICLFIEHTAEHISVRCVALWHEVHLVLAIL